MKKTLHYFCFFSLCCLLAFNSEAQSEKTRVLSYSEWFAEMTAYQEGDYYRLENATIQYDPATDQRFLGRDSLQLATTDSIVVNCHVTLNRVRLMDAPLEDGKFWLDSRRIFLQKIVFKDTVHLTYSKFEMKGFQHCSFKSLRFVSSDFENIYNNRFFLENCYVREYANIHDCQLKSDFLIIHSKFNGKLKIIMITGLDEHYVQIEKCQFESLSVSWVDIGRFILEENTIHKKAHFTNVTINSLEIADNHFSSSAMDSSASPIALFFCEYGKFEKITWLRNSFYTGNKKDWCLAISQCKITDELWLSETEFPGPIALLFTNITGFFDFGFDCQFKGGVFLKNLYFNERSALHWPNLQNKIALFDYKFMNRNLRDSIQSYGLLEKDLGNLVSREDLIKSKRIFQSVFRAQGLSRNANAVMVEIKDLETAIWKHDYMADNSLNSYFNWQMNAFLKKFSAYGTNPVIAIIYSLKVILIFALFYLFLHNDWDLNSRKKVGKRLAFMLKYLQVDKGLSELDREEQKDAKDSLNQLHTNNERSEGKVPVFLRKAIRWYVKSNLLSNNVRNFALRKMDILSGTYSALSKAKRTKVAFLSSVWLLIFLAYTLLVKVLNALTLSLNAFTTLGFGNIPTRGFSRYIVIVQGFIGWVLMTVFSVTLISQLLQ